MNKDQILALIGVLLILIMAGAMTANTIINRQARLIKDRDATIRGLTQDIAGLEYRLQKEPFTLPLLDAQISSGHGYRVNPLGGGDERLHRGVDLVTTTGSAVRAARDGRVVEHWVPPNGFYKGHPVYGGMVVVDHGEYFTVYAHLRRTFVHEQQVVKEGEIIGTIGSTGMSTGPHLHFEVVVDPFKYLQEVRK